MVPLSNPIKTTQLLKTLKTLFPLEHWDARRLAREVGGGTRKYHSVTVKWSSSGDTPGAEHSYEMTIDKQWVDELNGMLQNCEVVE